MPAVVDRTFRLCIQLSYIFCRTQKAQQKKMQQKEAGRKGGNALADKRKKEREKAEKASSNDKPETPIVRRECARVRKQASLDPYALYTVTH